MVEQHRFAFVEEMLERYKAATMEKLLAFLPDREPRRYLYSLIPSYPLRSGKGLRPGLCLATCGAFGGPTERAVATAAALELFHNAFLVHDDVEDQSESRRGAPTLSADHGMAIAVNVGDAMNVLSLHTLMANLHELGPQLTWRLLSEVEHMVLQSVEGQAVELGWVHDNVCDLGEDDYLRMTLKKTCWYTCIHPMRIGCLIATAGAVEPERFNRFGYYLGAAFQIQDDVLNLVGDEARYGKEIGGDILEGKRTLMVIHLLNACNGRERKRLQRFLAATRARRSPETAAWILDCMHHYGSIDFARSSARQLAGAALREFVRAFGDQADNEHKRFVGELVMYMIERDL